MSHDFRCMPARRAVLSLGCGAALALAGCGSAPVRGTAVGGGGVPTGRAPVPPSQPPLELDPAGREAAATVAPVVGDDGYAFLALQPTTQAMVSPSTV